MNRTLALRHTSAATPAFVAWVTLFVSRPEDGVVGQLAYRVLIR